MSFSLTIPVSMSHHYVNSHYYGGGGGANMTPAANFHHHQSPSAQIPIPVQPGLPPQPLPVNYLYDGRGPSPGQPIDGPQPLPPPPPVPERRAVPMRKQSVFVAPSGISAIRIPHTRSFGVSYINQLVPSSLSPPQADHCNHRRKSRTEWNPEYALPMDLSSETPHLQAPPPPPLEARHTSTPSIKDISQHISKLIQDNKAIIESYEPYPSGVRSSKRSLSTTHLQPPLQRNQNSPSSSSNNNNSSPGTQHPRSQVTYPSEPYRRYSTDVANYSKLQSALLGEAKQPLPIEKSVVIRKYSENIPYHHYSDGRYFEPTAHHPYYQESSVIMNSRGYRTSQSASEANEQSLVRNLLTSKTSPLCQLVNSEPCVTNQTTNQSSSDSSIIKDLLLKSRHLVTSEDAVTVASPPPPPAQQTSVVKRARTESFNSDPYTVITSGVVQQQPPPTVPPAAVQYTCNLCNISFRNEQNLEIHQKHYCRGGDSGKSPALKRKSCIESANKADGSPSRKVSVLERPSIITYPNSETSSVSSVCVSPTHHEEGKDDGNFGNILKSKLLAKSAQSEMSFAAIKRRKTSEPAFRYTYDSKRESTVKAHRVSVVQQTGSVDKSSAAELLEIIPAYTPYLMCHVTKITIKAPVLFPTLQGLVDNHINHEFTVDYSEGKAFVEPADPANTLLVKLNVQSQTESEIQIEVKKILDDVLEKLILNLDSSRSSWHQAGSDPEVADCLCDILDQVTVQQKEKPKGPVRPTTLDIVNTYSQSARNEQELKIGFKQSINSLSIFVNRCSNENEETLCGNQLVASNLISPDTPRPKRKYQQLFISGNAYTNLGLKVTTRPTYCCIYRPQPMFVTQQANPQLSMYSQWKSHSVPSGDILEVLQCPKQLLGAYNSQEAVYVASQARLSLVEVATAAKMGGLEALEALHDSESSVRHFLNRFSTCHFKTETTTRPEVCSYSRTLRSLVIPIGEGYCNRIVDASTRSQFLLTHSSYHSSVAQLKLPPQKSRKRSRTNPLDYLKVKNRSSGGGGGGECLPEVTNDTSVESKTEVKRKRSSTAMSVCSSAANPYLTMHPMLGHLPSKSLNKAADSQTVLYIMMMSQTPSVLSIPTVSQMASSKSFASRKFSENIGVRNPAIDDNWSTKIGPDGTTEYIPKRIKIFEGGFKSNEDYTYIRGRGRGKYVCEECGIRCKKPSMLKKHIRTHTDLRPYSCRHCAFAFKTKGNLTKHMKSKAHHKKCVELGIIPVPICIEDSQIDSEALAKQEQYELNCGSNNSLSQFADEEDDCDEDFDDDDEIDDDDEEDDEGVPIPLIEQQRLTYIEPGQFDDVDLDHNSSGTTSDHLTKIVANGGGGKMRKTSNIIAVTGCGIGVKRKCSPSIVPQTIDKQSMDHQLAGSKCVSQFFEIKSSAKIMSTNQASGGGDGGALSQSADISENSSGNSDGKSYHIGQNAINDSRDNVDGGGGGVVKANQNITLENEAEAARSLLILSGLTQNNVNIEKVKDEPPSKTMIDSSERKRSKAEMSHHQHVGSQPTSVIISNKVKNLEPRTTPSYHIDTAPVTTFNNLHSISSLITTSTPTFTTTTSILLANYATNNASITANSHLMPNYRRLSLEKTGLTNIIVDELKKHSIPSSEPPIQTMPLIIPPPTQPETILYRSSKDLPPFVPSTGAEQLRQNIIVQQILETVEPKLQPYPRLNELHSNQLTPNLMVPNVTITNENTDFLKTYSKEKDPVNKRLSPRLDSIPVYASQLAIPVTHLIAKSKSPSPILISPNANNNDDQPMDLSKNSKTRTPPPPPQPQPTVIEVNRATVLSPGSMQTSPSKYRYHNLIEQHNLTEQIARSFSPLSDFQPIPKSPSQALRNGHELYKNLRSEEFCHLTPGIHTPHRLPKNLRTFFGNRTPDPSTTATITSMSKYAPIQSSAVAGKSTQYINSEGKVTCPTCMKQFQKQAQLRLHLNIHQFERPFRCESCAVSFRTKGHLQKHSRSVSHLNKLNMSITFGKPSTENPRPFKCSDCQIAFRIHGHLAKHLRSKSHIHKLECLGSLPFGMFAEMERSNLDLSLIDTTDCDKALESLKSLAQQLYDPRQMCWDVPENMIQDNLADDVIEEDVDDDGMEDDSSGLLEEDSTEIIGQSSNDSSNIPTTTATTTTVVEQSNSRTSTSSISGIASTRSNTCNLCGRLFKAAKFLQVHLYCDHPEMAAGNETVATSA